jgi:hypothetical protein
VLFGGPTTRNLLGVAFAMGWIISLGYAPLLIHELGTGFSETRDAGVTCRSQGGGGGA